MFVGSADPRKSRQRNLEYPTDQSILFPHLIVGLSVSVCQDLDQNKMQRQQLRAAHGLPRASYKTA
jgi:hypothetical protein